MPNPTNLKLSEQLAREVKDPTQVEILTELVAEWLRAQSDKYVYFDDSDPCTCGGEEGANYRASGALTNLADLIVADQEIPAHRSGECRTDDDEEDEDED